MFPGKGASAWLVLLATLAAVPAKASLIVFGDSYSDAGLAGNGVHQAIHAALTTPQLDVGEPLFVQHDHQHTRSVQQQSFK